MVHLLRPVDPVQGALEMPKTWEIVGLGRRTAAAAAAVITADPVLATDGRCRASAGYIRFTGAARDLFAENLSSSERSYDPSSRRALIF